MSFTGTITALITPFKEGKLDEGGLRKNIWFQIAEGIDALLFLGSTGEGNALTTAEQKKIMEIGVQEGKGKVPIIFSTGDVSTQRAVEKTRIAEEMGGDGALVIAPYYVCPTQEGLFCHFEKIANSTSLPILVYNHPKRTGVNIEVETVIRLAEIDNIVGIKDASGSVAYAAAVMQALPHFSFLAGDDLMALPLSSVGGDGVVSVLSNLMPRKMGELVHTKDLELYRALYPFMHLCQLETNPIPIKAMMELSALPAGECRLPLTPLSSQNKKKVQEILDLAATYD